jgi:hypothetical protein
VEAAATVATAATAARQGGVWQCDCKNTRESGDGNTQAVCDADAFHKDLLLSGTVGLTE